MSGGETSRGVVTEGVELTLAEGQLWAPVLARVVGAMAAQAGLDIDRLSDATLAADAVADLAAGRAVDGRLRASAALSDHGLLLRFGPLPEGWGHDVRHRSSIPGVGPVVDGLADEIAVEAGPGGEEQLVLRFRHRGPGSGFAGGGRGK